MKHCQNCGSELKQTAKFCTSCGTPVPRAAPAPQPQPTPQPPPPVPPMAAAQPEQPPQTPQPEQPTQPSQPPPSYPAYIPPQRKKLSAGKAILLALGFMLFLVIVLGVIGLIFGKDGGDPAETTLKAPETTLPPSGTPAQQIWNGHWYGFLWVTEGYNQWAHMEDVLYDAHMFLEVDENGNGVLSISLDDSENETVSASIYADTHHFEVTFGYFWDMELDPDVWWLGISSMSQGNLVVIADTYIDPELTENDGFGFTCAFRPYGELWTEEVENNNILPPGYDDYVAALSR